MVVVTVVVADGHEQINGCRLCSSSTYSRCACWGEQQLNGLKCWRFHGLPLKPHDSRKKKERGCWKADKLSGLVVCY